MARSTPVVAVLFILSPHEAGYDISKALITSGVRFTGSHLADSLVARGDSVVVLDSFSTDLHET